jgi:primosomal protein N' (replication factor Y)
MITYGVGIEKLAEEVRELLPEAKTLTISSDSISHVKDAEKLLKEIAALEYEILIGTQILSKGLHFPRLNLVGVIDADIGATAQDLRATERSYQLMQQVSGRSGRETLGKVFIQTFNPQNSVIQALVTNEKNKLYEKELSIRKEFALPPFTRMIAIIVSSLDQKAAENYIVTLRKLAPATNNNVKILGPVEAPIHKIRNRYRFRMLALAPLNINIQKYVEFWLQQIKTPNKIRVKIDVDPYNFM